MPSFPEIMQHVPGVIGAPFRAWEGRQAREAQQKQLLEQAQQMMNDPATRPDQRRHMQNLVGMGNIGAVAQYMGQATNPTHQAELARTQAGGLTKDAGGYMRKPGGARAFPGAVSQQDADAAEARAKADEVAAQTMRATSFGQDKLITLPPDHPFYGALESAVHSRNPEKIHAVLDDMGRPADASYMQLSTSGQVVNTRDDTVGTLDLDLPAEQQARRLREQADDPSTSPARSTYLNGQASWLLDYEKRLPQIQSIYEDSRTLLDAFKSGALATGKIDQLAFQSTMREMLDKISVHAGLDTYKREGDARMTEKELDLYMRTAPGLDRTELTNIHRLTKMMDRIKQDADRAEYIQRVFIPEARPLPPATGQPPGNQVDIDFDAMSGMR